MLKKRAFALLLTLVMLATAVPTMTALAEPSDNAQTAADEQNSTGDTGSDVAAAEADSENLITSDTSELSYHEYLANHSDAKTSVPDVSLDLFNPTSKGDGTTVDTVEGEQAVVIAQDSYAEYTVDVPESGLYAINTRYLVPKGKMINAEARIYIDNAVPYTEATTVTFSRIWTDEEYAADADINEYGHQQDVSGNELTPDAVNIIRWQDHTVHDNDYMTDADLRFYLEAGVHTIRILLVRESLALSKLSLGDVENLPTYEEAMAEYQSKGYQKYSGEVIKLEAENTYERSEQSLTMAVDYASASTSPAHPSQTRLNTLGGELWNKTGQWVSWEVDVEQAGLYTLSFKYRQDYVRAFKVYRTISVNGVVPYQELNNVAFNSNSDWENMTVSSENSEPYYIYLHEGKNTICLTATLGPVAQSLQVLSDTISELNAIYLEIIQITGTSPDGNRDYDIDKNIPDLKDRFEAVKADLVSAREQLAKINSVNGKEIQGGQASFIDVMVKQLTRFTNDMRTITTALGAYKSNISSLSDTLRSLSSESLLLDCIYFGGEGSELPSEKVGFFSSLSFGIRGFFSSFVTDYNAFGNVYDESGDNGYVCEPIEVWMSSGRDQMNVLKTLIDDQFVKEYNIPVNLSLVDVNGSLTKAILAGTGPDCAVMVASTQPVSYSMRGALEDMDQFNAENQYTTDENGNKVQNYRYTFDEVQSWFYDSAFVALKYLDGKTYGLPETQAFNMLFYRTDVLKKLGLEPPETWQDLYNCVTIIQRQNMNIGMSGVEMFTNMLYQNGGKYYVDDFSAVNFNTEAAIKAFRDCTEFNTKYSLPLTYNALNRFRSGEYPLVVAAYTFYNELTVGAPEIKGLWKMTLIPGTVRSDGTVNHAQVSNGNVCIMIKGCDNKNQVYDFMSWWVGAQAQTDFGNKIEARLGIGGRYTTANKEAFSQLAWSSAEQEVLTKAWKDVTDTEKIPGDYYVTRMINNAYRAVVYKGQNPRESLLRYSSEMDKEIQRKREEYRVDEIRKAAGLDA